MWVIDFRCFQFLRVIAVLSVHWASCSTVCAQTSKPENLASAARKILEIHCYQCHGANPKKVSSNLNVLQRESLLDEERKIVVPGSLAGSELLRRITSTDADERMPPAPQSALNPSDVGILSDWIASGALEFGGPPKQQTPARINPADLASRVKEVFRVHCFDCHGGSRTNAGVKILDWDSLVTKRKKVIPGKASSSAVYRLIVAEDQTVMPPAGNPRLLDSDQKLIRDWISAGAPKFPVDVIAAAPDPNIQDAGAEYVLNKILAHVRSLRAEDRQFTRYFSTNHLVAAGVSRAELDLQRDAFGKAVNHLSRERQIVIPQVVDPPLATLFAVDLRKLGWHKQALVSSQKNQPTTARPLTIYDLALLEYPYGVINENSTAYKKLLEEFLNPGHFVRPVPFLRVDWFVSTVTQPPLYEDFLQLPFTVGELEQQLGVNRAGSAREGMAVRAGMTVSGVSRNNRVVERRTISGGAYWKSIDTATSKGRQNLFLDPLNIEAAGGEVIFQLPNGLQGYFLAAATGQRVSEAPTSIVTDKFAEDKAVRNGLACMRCHDQGMKDFVDTVRPVFEKLPESPEFRKRDVLALYASQDVMDRIVDEDRRRFLASMETLLGRPQTVEPLIPVSRRYLDEPLSLGVAAGELGLNQRDSLAAVFRTPQLISLGLASLGSPGGFARRDMWEDSFHQTVRTLGVGLPIVPLDGVTRSNFPPLAPSADVQLTTNRPGNVFAPGDEVVLTIRNNSSKSVYIELVGTSEKGEKIILLPASTMLNAQSSVRFPESGGIVVRGGVGKEQITLFACDQPFPPGEIFRGLGTTDRFVHDFYRMKIDRETPRLEFDATRMIKRRIDLETK